MPDGGTDRNETFCRVCSERMGDEDGHTHTGCRQAAKEEFEWYQ